MSNNNSNVSDELIHSMKLTWSVGKSGFPEPPKENFKDTTVDKPNDNIKDASYKWLMAQKLSNKMR